MESLEDIALNIESFVSERDWDQFHNPKDLAISLSLEASEVLEHFQWKNEKEIKTHLAKNKIEFSHELADVLIYLLLLAKKTDTDLAEAVKQKIKKSQQKYPVDKSKGNHKKYTEIE